MAATPAEVVRSFCEAFRRRDVDELLSYFAPGAVYHNIPVDPAVGHDAIRALLEMFVAPARSLEFRVRNLAVAGEVVLTERVDVFEYPDVTIELPVMGAFEVEEGKIVAWRDYFDLEMYMSRLRAGQGG